MGHAPQSAIPVLSKQTVIYFCTLCGHAQPKYMVALVQYTQTKDASQYDQSGQTIPACAASACSKLNFLQVCLSRALHTQWDVSQCPDTCLHPPKLRTYCSASGERTVMPLLQLYTVGLQLMIQAPVMSLA